MESIAQASVNTVQSQEATHLQFDYETAAGAWLNDLHDWRVAQTPQAYYAIASELRPRRIRTPDGPEAFVANLMIRSLNVLDEDKIGAVTGKFDIAKQTIAAAKSFYERGDYYSHREELFDKAAESGIGEDFPRFYTRLAEIINKIPDASLENSGFSKLCRVIGAVAFLSVIENGGLGEVQPDQVLTSLHTGYDFAATYPLVDDLLHDTSYLGSFIDKSSGKGFDFNAIIEQILQDGNTDNVKLPRNTITDELMYCFDDILERLPFESNRELYDAVLMLQYAQTNDATLAAQGELYKAEDYDDYVLKAALTRVIPRMLVRDGSGAEVTDDMLHKIVGLGLRVQLHDDIMDIQDDVASGSNTPVTLAMNTELAADDINPVHLFVDASFYSLENDYELQQRSRAAKTILGVISDAFQGYTSAEFRAMNVSPEYQTLIEYIGKAYPSARVERFSRQYVDKLALERTKLRKAFDVYVMDVQERVGGRLSRLAERSPEPFSAMYAHSMESSAKRIRPVLAYITGDTFGAERAKLDDFCEALEVFHTASLIFDDLPGQDNSELRRGKKTAHIAFGEGLAQMSAVAMLFDAQNTLQKADSEAGLNGALVTYMNTTFGKDGLCLGQVNDLATFQSNEAAIISLQELDEISHLKTGLALESGIVGAAMIAGAPQEAIDQLKQFSRHLGIAFQTQDDVLDANGLDKTADLDKLNGKPNYVSMLGIETAKQKLAWHLAQANQALEHESFSSYSMIKFRELVRYLEQRG